MRLPNGSYSPPLISFKVKYYFKGDRGNEKEMIVEAFNEQDCRDTFERYYKGCVMLNMQRPEIDYIPLFI